MLDIPQQNTLKYGFSGIEIYIYIYIYIYVASKMILIIYIAIIWLQST